MISLFAVLPPGMTTTQLEKKIYTHHYCRYFIHTVLQVPEIVAFPEHWYAAKPPDSTVAFAPV